MTALPAMPTSSTTTILPVASVQIGERARRDLGDCRALARSIADVGLLHPIVVGTHCQLIAGSRRLEAVRLLGWEEIPVTVVGTLDEAVAALRAERDENVMREPLKPTEAVALAEALEPYERAEAKRREDVGAGRPKKGVESTPFSGKAKARDKVAVDADPCCGRWRVEPLLVADTGWPDFRFDPGWKL